VRESFSKAFYIGGKIMAVWTEKFIQPNKYSRPQNKLTAVRKIVMHYTANNGASANGHYNYFNNLKGYASDIYL
jgi:N-acetylmuramoyl-L-alanine amidase CwlA